MGRRNIFCPWQERTCAASSGAPHTAAPRTTRLSGKQSAGIAAITRCDETRAETSFGTAGAFSSIARFSPHWRRRCTFCDTHTHFCVQHTHDALNSLLPLLPLPSKRLWRYYTCQAWVFASCRYAWRYTARAPFLVEQAHGLCRQPPAYGARTTSPLTRGTCVGDIIVPADGLNHRQQTYITAVAARPPPPFTLPPHTPAHRCAAYLHLRLRLYQHC